MNYKKDYTNKDLHIDSDKAFENLFTENYCGLRDYARLILKDQDDAEDAVENAFIQLWENRENITTSAKSYLFKSVYHNCLNYLKHLNVREKYEIYFRHHVSVDDLGNFVEDAYPLKILLEKESVEALEKAVNNLPEECGKIFRLSRYENLKNEEIAGKLNISVNTVRVQISRALSRLRVALKDFLVVLLLYSIN